MADQFWVFVCYSFLGWMLERAFAAVSGAPRSPRRCLLVLPLCPVYGLGMTALLALPASMRTGLWLPVAGALVTTAVEYVYHWACEALFGVRFWDYTGVWGNVNGRVCLPFSLAWGVLAALGLWGLHPALAALTARIPPLVTYWALLFFTVDAVCSCRILAVTHSLAALRGGG